MTSLIDTVGRWVAFPATLGILLLLPLYLSQRRDIARLRAWREREPDHPQADLVASEALLDRAEAELQALLTERGEPATAAGPPTTGDRPALTQITVERAALEPHPRWRRFAGHMTSPRGLAVLALLAVLVAVGAVVGSREFLKAGSSSSGGGHHNAGIVVPAQVTVAVLNGTAQPGLGATVGDSLRRKGFSEGTIATARRTYQQTVVMYGKGQKSAAERVAKTLGVTVLQPIDRTTRAIAGAADVVVIAGRDKARS
jgi:LytR cell envelope-related transcriptional attenuator